MTDERSDGEALAVHLEREYSAAATEVWDAWTDPERLTRWLAAPSRGLLTAAADAPVRLTFGDGADDWADVVVTRAEAPRLLELRWGFGAGVVSVLRVEILPLDDHRVRVVVDHRGLGDSTVGYGAGWEAYLVQLGGELGRSQTAGWYELFEAALPAWQERAQRAGG